MKQSRAQLILEDGTSCTGDQFGAEISTAGEVVFNTGMVGYPEAMTDPSYRGQILVLTYPLIGNYGIPQNGSPRKLNSGSGLPAFFESDRIQVQGIIISSLSVEYSHWTALDSLDSWMKRNNVPGICGLDTRGITKRLRTHGTMLGKIIVNDKGVEIEFEDPNKRNLVAEVGNGEVQHFAGGGKMKIILVDLGCKTNIMRRLQAKGLDIVRVPWNHDWSEEEADGVVLSNGPGDPKMCSATIAIIRKGMERGIPMMGICLGHQLMALAAGADTYKMKFGHRSQNQPCIQVGTRRCYITSQNHGYAVNEQSLGSEWLPWFFNANDGTNEGMRHRTKPMFSVQFHPEAHPGPTDTDFIFEHFLQSLKHGG